MRKYLTIKITRYLILITILISISPSISYATEVGKNKKELLFLGNVNNALFIYKENNRVKGLEEMNNDGSMDKILDKWGGENVVCFTETEIKKNTYYILVGAFLLIVMLSLITINKLRRINHQLELKVIERTKELYEANEKLKEISTIDGLTNIFNRRHFDYELKKNWAISLREKQPLTLILLDIDHFKKCNDTYGHLAGDYYLKIIANILKESVKRSGDTVARFGGEEFVALLLNTPEKNGTLLAERIREKIENKTVVFEGNQIRNTVSIGVATLIPNEELDSTDLIKLADQAMYQAKNNGRNQVVTAKVDI